MRDGLGSIDVQCLPLFVHWTVGIDSLRCHSELLFTCLGTRDLCLRVKLTGITLRRNKIISRLK